MADDGTTHRDRLFGLIAERLGLIDRARLAEALRAWSGDRGRPLGDVLVERADLGPGDRAAVEAALDAVLARHGGDPAPALIALAPDDASRMALEVLADPDLTTSLQRTRVWPALAAAPAAASPPPINGARFRILRPHARGGLGVVHVAHDAELDRPVALKQLHDRHADAPGARARFLREAEITGKLEHPGVVPVYSLGYHADGWPYYAMRFVEGESLKDAIARLHGGPPPASPPPASGGREPPDADASDASDASLDTRPSAPQSRDPQTRHNGPDAAGSGGSRPPLADSLELRRLLRRFLEVCNTVAYAHSRGVIHRDIKPANILLGPYGETLLVDWGLAKPIDEAEEPAGPLVFESATATPTATATATPGPGATPVRLGGSGSGAETLPGAAIGTPSYMSPEQAEGGRVGPAADIYGLGATLYHLLTGRAPLEGRSVSEALGRRAYGQFPTVRQVNPAVPRALEAICARAMARRPEDRYADARALADDVERWLDDAPVSAYRETVAERLQRWGRRHRPWVAASAAVLVLAVVGLTMATYLLGREQRRTAEQRRLAERSYQETKEAVRTFLKIAGRHQQGDTDALRRDILSAARDYFAQFAREHRDDPTIADDLAWADFQAAESLRVLTQLGLVFRGPVVVMSTEAPVPKAGQPEAREMGREVVQFRMPPAAAPGQLRDNVLARNAEPPPEAPEAAPPQTAPPAPTPPMSAAPGEALAITPAQPPPAAPVLVATGPEAIAALRAAREHNHRAVALYERLAARAPAGSRAAQYLARCRHQQALIEAELVRLETAAHARDAAALSLPSGLGGALGDGAAALNMLGD